MRTRLAFAVVVLAASASAQAQIYKCEGPNGVVEYSNSPTSTQGGRNCKSIDLQPITTIPAPKVPVRPAPAATSGSGASAGAAARPASSPEGFPRVDAATQKARDSDRRRILDEELKKEETRLAELKKEYNNGEPERRGDERNYQKYLDRVQALKDDIARTEANLTSIRREIASVKE
jgi:hypothetical protein